MNPEDAHIVETLHRQTSMAREAIQDILEEQERIALRRGRGLTASYRDPVGQARAEIHELCRGGQDKSVVPVLLAVAVYRQMVGLIDDETLDAYVTAVLDAFDEHQAFCGLARYIPSRATVRATA